MSTNEEDDSNNARDMFTLSREQSEKIGSLLDYNQSVVRAARVQAENWHIIVRSYYEMAEMAQGIADDCALFARLSVDRVGDLLSTEYNITEVTGEEDDDDDNL